MTDPILDAPRGFTLIPFWFWNDVLDEGEILRQIDDFEQHGVHGFVIHPRVGLPRDCGFMSDGLLGFMRIAIEEAARRGMQVILYDEGMYPSGAAGGLVVKQNPHLVCRGLAKQDLAPGEEPRLEAGWNLVAVAERENGAQMAIIDRPANSFIRGLHYIGNGPAEEEPPMSDILNPEATAAFLRIVYDGFYNAFGEHFGKTITAIFTDEPSPLGRCREGDAVRPGTTGILPHVNRLLGEDFTPHLPALWHDDEPDAARFRANYHRAIRRRLEETWYRPLDDWCDNHGIALTGHPASGDEIGPLRHFHIPGQDLVWRWVEPGKPTGLEGPESTQAKCAASAMIHLGRRRNGNEFCGAYGSDFTFEEMKALADWCLVRGTNLLIPHAFYYSVRGLRRDERPPQLGPHSPWWDGFKCFADYCRRLCALNTDSTPVVRVAVLTDADHCPWHAAKVCFEHQHDFHYLELRHLVEEAAVEPDGLHLAGMRYEAVVLEHGTAAPDAAGPALDALRASGRLLHHNGEDALLLAALDRLVPRTLRVDPPTPALRARRILKNGRDHLLLFNESEEAIRFGITDPLPAATRLLDVFHEHVSPFTPDTPLEFGPFATRLLVSPSRGECG